MLVAIDINLKVSGQRLFFVIIYNSNLNYFYIKK